MNINASTDLPTTPTYHQIRASYTETTITVYQAYNETIATAALSTQSLNVPTFKPDRMTWIKPSFRWILYRSGHATKPNQEHILALHMTRSGFEQALKWSGRREDGAEVRVQWDPERGMEFEGLGWRSIQIGLRGRAVREGLLGGWVVGIEDVTEVARRIGELVRVGKGEKARALLPKEEVYEFLDEEARVTCGAD
jgi:Domain of unknown function (DUF4291)